MFGELFGSMVPHVNVNNTQRKPLDMMISIFYSGFESLDALGQAKQQSQGSCSVLKPAPGPDKGKTNSTAGTHTVPHNAKEHRMRAGTNIAHSEIFLNK